MGVPKFYRWISERYPTLSEVVRDYQIPEFDNLYLDMNGIIHTCSHPNDSDPHFRITEEKIFEDIFRYIEVLFRMIQPGKVFFMAVDGVAPRAKMNQQRGRRFRSAREAEENELKAKAKGEVLPTEARFDSNCITPGTDFMDRLDAQLRYLVTQKISSDPSWQKCTVIYSGHQSPGEGEHKIMEYIRYCRSQASYDANIRHCLYGLDADLIMLGLSSHDPNFSLLREEVQFGRVQNKKRTTTAEETTFHLLHLSLMREYINLEFVSVAPELDFEYDIEKIIDDWVLMGFLIGNDFIPHLPTLHINKDAFPTLFDIYKKVLPSMGGYMNEGGNLNLVRFEKFMAALADYDTEAFNELNADLKYFSGKQGGGKTAGQRVGELESFFGEEEGDCLLDGGLEGDRQGPVESASDTLARLGFVDQPYQDSDEDEEDEDPLAEEFRQHKRNYYVEKMHYRDTDKLNTISREQTFHYVQGIQWILHYYYNGIASWSWYYPFHYAPYISDVRSFSSLTLKYDIGRPFRPFEQLLAVLPPASAKFLPKCFQILMLNDSSPVTEFYPKTFETDLNGKQQDWEAVVLIPFIDEVRLLDAMANVPGHMTEDEHRRNAHGPVGVYNYTKERMPTFKSPGYFPDIVQNFTSVQFVERKEWDLDPRLLVKGPLAAYRSDLCFKGFPNFKHVKFDFEHSAASVRVFNSPSRGMSIVLTVPDPYEVSNISNITGCPRV